MAQLVVQKICAIASLFLLLMLCDRNAYGCKLRHISILGIKCIII
ncbi:MAG: hypothetical protein RMY36_014455 [Nostoc sp. SerVER01]|nr:hypothetical protein [Nostoc sp. SerVER01]